MDNSKAGNHVGGQLLRSGTSPFFNHGEAEAAESPRDFIHRMGVCLKELRESKRALRLVERVSPYTGYIEGRSGAHGDRGTYPDFFHQHPYGKRKFR